MPFDEAQAKQMDEAAEQAFAASPHRFGPPERN